MDGVRLILGDALEALRGMAPGSVDAVVTDPPYGLSGCVLNPYRNGPDPAARTVNDWHPPSSWDRAVNPEWCREACRLAAVVAWFGNWRRREEVAAAMSHPLRAEIVWVKNVHVGPPCPLAMRDERIWLFAARRIEGRRFETSVWEEPIKHTRAFRYHRNEKPVRLMRRLVTFLVDEGAAVLDPFMGAGTTGLACEQTGRRFIGVESDPRYFAVAERRLADARGPLFANGTPGEVPCATAS